jgi:3-oxoacyl-[acyl-carrier protein] reductase
MSKEKLNALVTGSSRGIGFAIAKEFTANGYKVILNGRDENSLKRASKELNTNYFLGDVSDPQIAKKMVNYCVSEFGDLNALVCNVGSGKSLQPGKENNEEWKKMFDVNFLSTTNVIESSVKTLSKTKGSIVCISSICGVKPINSAPVTYSVSKAALNFYVHAYSKYLGTKGVRINSVALGNIQFPGSTWEEKLKKNKKQVEDMLKNEVALTKFGNTDDASKTVFFLSSDEAKFITGATLIADGGQV